MTAWLASLAPVLVEGVLRVAACAILAVLVTRAMPATDGRLRRAMILSAALWLPAIGLTVVATPPVLADLIPWLSSSQVPVPQVPLEIEVSASSADLRVSWFVGIGLFAWLVVAGVRTSLTVQAFRQVAARLPAGGLATEPLEDALRWAGGAGLTDLRIGAAPSGPAAAGLRRPSILLPESALDWSSRTARAVIAHEVGHIRHQDVRWQLYLSLLTDVLWCVPGVALVARTARHEMECAADAWAMVRGMTPSDYVEAVIEVAQSGPGTHRPRWAVGLDDAAIGFATRMRRILASSGTATRGGGVRLAVIAGPIACATVLAIPPRAWPEGDSARSVCMWSPSRGLLDRTRPVAPDRSEWTVRWEGRDCSVEWRAVGQVSLDARTGAVRLGGESDSLVLVISHDSGLVRAMTHSSDGTAGASISSEEMAGLIRALDRHTGFAASVKVPMLYRAGGLRAVLVEAERSTGGHAPAAVLQEALRLGQRTPQELATMLALAQRVVTTRAALEGVTAEIHRRRP